eukprot:m.93066 g.93066  ORF g.93066 m.93066 type:complete len:519 (-) comp14688_c1_seq2:39-1595(-)
MAEDAVLVAWMAVNPDDNDRINRKQLLDAVHFLGLNPTKKIMREFAAEAGEADALFTFQQLKQLINKIPSITADDLIQAFRIIDEDGDGTLSREELIATLMNFGERMTKAEVEQVMEFDTDKSGSIEYQEFCNMCMAFADQIKAMKPPPERRLSSASSLTASTIAPDDDESTKETTSKHRYSKQNAATKTTSKSPSASSRTTSSTPTTTKTQSQAAANKSATKAAKRKQPQKPAVTPSIPSASILKTWSCWHLHGRIQAQKETLPASQLFQLSVVKKTQLVVILAEEPSHVPPPTAIPGELECLLVNVEASSSTVILATSLVAKQHALVTELEPGQYTLIPMDVSGKFHPRESDASDLVTLCMTDSDDCKVFSDKATTVLDEVFRSFDIQHKGRLSRQEYDALLTQTDGESCEDDVWNFILENFDVEGGELTRRGFFQIYSQMIADETNDEGVYPHFQQLGYNKQLQADEVKLFNLSCYASETGAVSDLSLRPFDLELVKNSLHRWKETNGSTKPSRA